ncbi:Uncharacterized protein dnl_51560 [Desulfonema limicola]|uniref:Uncharacterized protein n=1 Tax=Desulfonema limicola TaxID=45656 RepID=A0A975BCJ1_9BACT|nr:hypothetical protein [Desulfonema limicola]QTA82773.1 Uncharacterized protein dnl_51560 [Desulfonema limicola]
MKQTKPIENKELIKTKASLWAVFPNLETYHDFINENQPNALISFIRYAKLNGAIAEESEKSFEEFINQNKHEITVKEYDISNISLKDLPEKLQFDSFRWLCSRIKILIKKFELDIPSVSPTMFSRLNNEPANTNKKKNALRILAFWIGQERPAFSSFWNYETLLNLCPHDLNISKITEGARLAVSLQGRGDVINEATIKWLRTELKSCIQDMNIKYASIESGTSFHITEFSIKIPIQSATQNNFNHPKIYGKCIRDAIAIAHQISVRWILSPHNSPKKFLSVGIASGDFSELDIPLKTLINAKLQGDPIIRVTDYTHMCILINNIQVICCDNPIQIDVPDGSRLTLWWFIGLWSTIYWDFAPIILNKNSLASDDESKYFLKKALWFPDQLTSFRDLEKGNAAIINLFKFPQNALLGFEIAKTFFYRNMFFEANEILKIILSTEPKNLVARTLRINIFMQLSLKADLPYSIAETYYRWFENEAKFCLENCKVDEEFYCEYALAKLAQALKILRILRSDNDLDSIKRDSLSDLMIKTLKDSLSVFEKAATLSPTGYRSLYWYVLVSSFTDMLLKDNELIFNKKPFIDKHGCSMNTVVNMFKLLGWLPHDDMAINSDTIEFLKQRLWNAANTYNDTILNRGQKPSTTFYYAILNWDLNPFLDVKTARQVILWLREAINIAETVRKDNLYVFSTFRLNSDVISIDKFIEWVNILITEIEKRVGSYESLLNRKGDESITPEESGGFKLFCHLVDENI